METNPMFEPSDNDMFKPSGFFDKEEEKEEEKIVEEETDKED